MPTLNFALVGRWVGHWRRGKRVHDPIAKAAPIKNELMIPRRFEPVLFGFILSALMSFVVSGTSTWKVIGLGPGFASLWTDSWLTARLFAFPIVLPTIPLRAVPFTVCSSAKNEIAEALAGCRLAATGVCRFHDPRYQKEGPTTRMAARHAKNETHARSARKIGGALWGCEIWASSRSRIHP